MSTSNPKSVTVLIVDDDYHFNVDIMTYYLKRIGGYEVRNAFTVRDFRERVNEADVIILDIRLPDDMNAPIDPWGGLKALKDLSDSAQDNESLRKRLSRVIIRSVHSKDDAKRAEIPVPDHYCWLSVDAPLSKIMTALKEVAGQIE